MTEEQKLSLLKELSEEGPQEPYFREKAKVSVSEKRFNVYYGAVVVTALVIWTLALINGYNKYFLIFGAIALAMIRHRKSKNNA